jgi:PEP-CTERM motif
MRKLTGLVAMVAVLAAFSHEAEGAPLLVSADATVAGGLFANENFGAEDYGGGLLSGVDGSALSGPYRFYLMFALPAFTTGTVISSAVLEGIYIDDWDTFDDRTHSLYQAPTTWSESTITWNNQPGSIGGPIGSFNAATAALPSVLSWNITAAVNTAYLAHNLLFSVMFRADDETLGVAPVINNNLEYFVSREFAGAAAGFRIDVTVAAVPEPATALLLAAGLAGALGRRHWRRR